MESGEGARPAGWYDDPGYPGRHRWWDGNAWGPPAPPPGAPPPGIYGPPPGMYGGYPQANPLNLAEEERSGNRAMSALWFGAAAYGIQAVCQIAIASSLVAIFTTMFHTMSTATPGSPATVEPLGPTSGIYAAATAVGQIVGLGVLVVGIIFLVWFSRALNNAKALGIPQWASPVWGVVGFFIPIGNFVLPYLSAGGLFPPEHPDRRLVGRWWAFWLGAQFSVYALIGAALVSIPVALVIALGVAGLYYQAAVCARAMIKRSCEVHTELAGQLGVTGSAGAGTPWYPTGPAPGYPASPDFAPKDPWAQS